MSLEPTTMNLTLCDLCEGTLGRSMLVINIDLALLLIAVASIVIFVHNYWHAPIIMHGNLLILFANLVLLTFITCASIIIMHIRHTFVYLVYKNRCDFLTTFWQNAAFLSPQYVYYFAYPLFHFAIMVERARATFMAEKYENTGNRLGILMAIGIWICSIIYTAIIIFTAYIDPDLSAHPQTIVTLTSKYNNIPVVSLYIGIIPFVILTAFCDWRITKMNIRLRACNANYFHEYSLSRNYQLNENTLAMRLILPLNVFYALLYTIFTTLCVIIRLYKSSVTSMEYIFYYYCANSLNYIYWIITFIVYIRFVNFVSRKQKRRVYAQQPQEPSKIYFKQLTAQWNR